MTANEAWILRYEGFDPDEEGLREALCAIGNGNFCTRGAAPEASADDVHYPGTYMAGLYNRLVTEFGTRKIENEDLVNLPNWLVMKVGPEDGEWFNVRAATLLEYRQELDLKRAVLTRHVRYRDKSGRITALTFEAFADMANRHLAALRLSVTPENWSGRVVVQSGLDGRIANAGVDRYREFNSVHLETLDAFAGEEGMFLKVRTNQSRCEVALAARTTLSCRGEALDATRRAVSEEGFVAEEFSFDAAEGRTVRADKMVAIYTSRDPAISECGIAARERVARVQGFDKRLAAHVQTWAHLWRRCDIEIAPNTDPQRILRLHIFHLLQTTSPNIIDLDAGVPARGLHGEAYRGHIFWDELFILPFLTLRLPDVARGLLLYRFRRLDAARWNARQGDYDGAMYPWQSGSDGREESQEIHLNPRSGRWIPDNSRLQRHVNAAIAYNIWLYVQSTGDMDFLAFYGAEVVLEIARFWSSIASYNEALGRYEIRGVMGPDEYHDAYPHADQPGLNNNAYTNVMAVWVLCRALDILEMLDQERLHGLRERLELTEDVITRWKDISHRMTVPVTHNGIIEQFEGFCELDELDWDRYRSKYGNIQRLDRILEAEGENLNRYQACKQADVLMLFYLFSADELAALFARLGYRLDEDMIRRNVEYYLPRTSNGSTLGRIVHSWVLSRFDRQRSWNTFYEALKSDVSDIQDGTTSEGIHLGAMAGTIDILQRCYTGLEARRDTLFFNPRLPEHLQSIVFRLRFRGHWLTVDVRKEGLSIEAGVSRAGPINVSVKGEAYKLHAEETLRVRL